MPQRVYRLLDLNLGRLQNIQDVLQASVEFPRRDQTRYDAVDRRQRRKFPVGQRLQGVFHRFDQTGGVSQSPMIGLQLYPLVGRKRELSQLLQLPLESLAFSRKRVGVLLPFDALARKV